MKSVLFGSSQSNTANGVTFGINASYNSTSNATNTFREQIVPAPITLSNFYVSLASAPGGVASITVSIMKNGSASAVTVTITGSATSATDSTHSVSFNAGDLIGVTVTTSGSPTNSRASWNVGCTSTSGDYFPMFGGMMGSLTATTSYAYPYSTSNNSTVTTEAQAEIVIPCAGTLSNMYVATDVAPGTGNSIQFVPYKNGSAGLLTATISGASATSASDTTDSITVSAGDRISMQLVKSTSLTSARFFWGIQFTPTTVGQSFFAFGNSSAPSTATTNYEQPLGIGLAGWNATESTALSIPGACTLQALYWMAGTAPGTVASWALTVRKNSTNTALSATITGSATTANITGQNVTLAQSDIVDLQMVPSTVPAAMTNGAHAGVLVYIAPSSSGHGLSLLGVGN